MIWSLLDRKRVGQTFLSAAGWSRKNWLVHFTMGRMSIALQKSPAELLATPVQFLKGVGPQRAELLAKLDLYYAADVLFFFPRAYQDMSELRGIEQLEEGKLASVVGVIDEV